MKLIILLTLALFSFDSFAKLRQANIVDAVEIASPTQSVTSSVVDLGNYERFSIFGHLSSTSSATGTMTISTSNDNVASSDLVTNWVTHGTPTVFTASIKDLMSNITDSAARWLKVTYTKEGPTATATLTVTIYIP